MLGNHLPDVSNFDRRACAQAAGASTIWASKRASAAPTQKCAPFPKADVVLGFSAVEAELARLWKWAGSRLAAPHSSSNCESAGNSTPARVVSLRTCR